MKFTMEQWAEIIAGLERTINVPTASQRSKDVAAETMKQIKERKLAG